MSKLKLPTKHLKLSQIFLAFCFLCFFSLSSMFVSAATIGAEEFNAGTLESIEGNISGFRFAGGTIGTALSLGVWSPVAIILYISGAFFLFNLIMAGFQLMTSQGTPQAIQSAKTRLLNSILGLVLVFTAYWIVKIVGAFLGLEGIDQTFR